MKKLLLLLLVLAIPAISIAEANQSNIVAIVNDAPITKYDFNERKKLIKLMFNVDSSIPGVDAQINRDVLKSLIETEILKQHFEKTGGKVSEEDIQETIRLIEKQNKMPPGGMRHFITSRGVKFSTFKEQVIGERIKLNIVQSISSATNVSQKEIENTLIYNSPKDFEVEAWVFTSRDIKPDTLKSMKQLKSRLSRLQKCNNVPEKLYSNFADGEKFDRYLKKIEGKIQSVIKDTKVGESSSIFKDNNSYKLVFVCKKQAVDLSESEEGNVKYFVLNKKSTKRAEKFLSDLKQKTYIQILDPALK